MEAGIHYTAYNIQDLHTVVAGGLFMILRIRGRGRGYI
jgi:hypothetical protein